MARALQAVHELGIIHRDIKPSNILMDRSPNRKRPTPKLTDFGIARDLDGEQSITTTGLIVGTPSYMAPEQTGYVPACGQVSPQTDIHALGAVLYSLLTGRPPYFAPNAYGVLLKVSAGIYTPLRDLKPEIPSDLESIVVKCLEHLPANRYPSAEALALDLDCLLDGRPVRARLLTSRRVTLSRWFGKRPLKVATLMIGFAMVAWELVGSFHGTHPETQNPQAKFAGLNGIRPLVENAVAVSNRVRRADLNDSGVIWGQIEEDLRKLKELVDSGQHDEALLLSQQKLEKLDAESEPQKNQPTRNYYQARLINSIIDLLMKMNRHEDALPYIPRLHEMARIQSSQDSQNQQLVSELFLSALPTRMISQRAGHQLDAAALLLELRALCQKRLDADPAGDEDRRTMMKILVQLGNTMFDIKRLDEWNEAYESIRKIASELMATSPKNPEWRHIMCFANSNQGFGMAMLDRFHEAEDLFENALKFATPDRVGGIHLTLAKLGSEIGDLEKATRECLEAMKYPELQKEAESVLRNIEELKAKAKK